MSQIKVESLPVPLRMLVILAQHFWFIWCCFVFLFTGVVALACYVLIFNLLDDKRAIRYTYFVTHWWGRALMAGMLVRVTSEGKENVRTENGPYILVSNHLSMCDIPVCMAASPVSFSFLAKKEVDRIPVVGYLARNMHVYVDRKSKQSRAETAERMKAHINNGHSIMIYPEGTRNLTDKPLKSFYDGAFKLAIETQRPIAVVTLLGTHRITSGKEPYRASPAWVHCVWDEPVETNGMTMDDLDLLKEKVQNRMLRNLEEYYAEYPA